MATLTVGQNKQYSTINAALLAAKDGDTVAVSAGTYTNDVATIRTRVSLVAVGGQVTLLSTQPLAPGRGLLTVSADATIDGFIFGGATSADGTGAGLLYTGGALVVRNSLFTGNQNGLLAMANATGTVLIQSSEFARNGNNDGFSHNISVGAIKSLTIQDSYIHDALGGSEVRSRARSTMISNSRLIDNGSAANVSLDLPNAGVVLVQNSVIEKGAQSPNPAVIRFGAETPYASSSLKISGSTIVSDRPGATLLQNQTSIIANISGNQVYGFNTGKLAAGPAALSANVTVFARPAVTTAPLITPAIALPVEFGRAGAVAASGAVLTVGLGGAFTTLTDALTSAHDGDTIRIAAGTYNDDGLTISHKLIIEGTGGLARFVSAAAPGNGLAQFVITTDVTFRNIEITGVAVPGGVAAAIRSQGGNLTLVNSYIHDNQVGLVADKGTAGSVAVYDTEIARNGTPDGRGANIDVAEIGSLTLRNDWVHDSLAGPEIRSRADNTVIDATRVSQMVGNGTADIELPNAGRVTITASAIEKGAFSQTAPLIQVGGDTAYAGSVVSISGTTLISDMTSVPTTFVANQSGEATVAVSGSTFVGGTAGSKLVQNGANTGAVKKSGVSIGGATPWGKLGAPAATPLTVPTPAPAPAEHGILQLRISGDAYQGDARFTVSVDGAQVAGILAATASHAAGQSQTFTIAGSFAAGPHSVGVQFVNDLQGDGPGQDRNLYVDGLSFNGEEVGAPAALMANGAAMLSTGPVSSLTPITVNLSEDAWKGDAQAFIAIDGQVLNGVQVVTASHTLGQTQAMRFLLDLAPGAHSASVTFLNPASGGQGLDRHLYVDSIDIAGQHYGSAAASLTDNTTSAFAFTVAPPAANNAGLFLTAGLPQPLAWLMPAS